MAFSQLIPAERFAGAHRVPRGGRFELRYGDALYDDMAQIIDIVPQQKPRGIQYIEDATMEFVKELRRVGAAHIQACSEDWQEYLDQLEGVIPEAVEGILETGGVNVAVRIHGTQVASAKKPLESGNFFRYIPRDFTPVGTQIAESMEEISRSQIFQDEAFQFERDQAALWASVCGIAMMILEHERKIEARFVNGQWVDTIVDRGTRPRAVSPFNTFFTDWKQPYIEKQQAIGYSYEVQVPILESQALSVMLQADGQTAWPEGQFFNLDKIQKIRPQTSSYVDTDDGKQVKIAPLEAAIHTVLAFTFWCKNYNVKGLARRAMGEFRTSESELEYWLGWRADDIQRCPIWKLTAVCKDPVYGRPGGTAPDVLIQAAPSRYAHGEYPAGWCQCVDFPGRTISLSNGSILFHSQKMLNTIYSLIMDGTVKNAMDMYVIARGLLAAGQMEGKFKFTPNMVLDMKEGYTADDARKVLARLEYQNPFVPHALGIAEGIVGKIKEETNTARAPFQGDKTAFEISTAVAQAEEQTGAGFGKNLRYLFSRIARHQVENNAQFMTVQDGIRLAGSAGLDLRKMQTIARFQEINGVSIFEGMPVKVKVLGAARIGDALAEAKVFTALTTSPLFAVWVQTGGNMPRPLKRMFEYMLSLILEDPSQYVVGGEKRSTQEIMELLMMEEPVELDPERFAEPDPMMSLQKMRMELVAVEGLAARGGIAARIYAEELRAYYEMERANAIMLAQQMGGGPKGPGLGRGIAANPVARGFQTPRGTPLARPGTESMQTEMIKSAVPTFPIAG